MSRRSTTPLALDANEPSSGWSGRTRFERKRQPTRACLTRASGQSSTLTHWRFEPLVGIVGVPPRYLRPPPPSIAQQRRRPRRPHPLIGSCLARSTGATSSGVSTTCPASGGGRVGASIREAWVGSLFVVGRPRRVPRRQSRHAPTGSARSSVRRAWGPRRRHDATRSVEEAGPEAHGSPRGSRRAHFDLGLGAGLTSLSEGAPWRDRAVRARPGGQPSHRLGRLTPARDVVAPCSIATGMNIYTHAVDASRRKWRSRRRSIRLKRSIRAGALAKSRAVAEAV